VTGATGSTGATGATGATGIAGAQLVNFSYFIGDTNGSGVAGTTYYLAQGGGASSTEVGQGQYLPQTCSVANLNVAITGTPVDTYTLKVLQFNPAASVGPGTQVGALSCTVGNGTNACSATVANGFTAGSVVQVSMTGTAAFSTWAPGALYASLTCRQ
jgi:hypothetical protein